MDEVEDDSGFVLLDEALSIEPPPWLAYLDTAEGSEDEARRAWVLFLYVSQNGWPSRIEIGEKVDSVVRYLKTGKTITVAK